MTFTAPQECGRCIIDTLQVTEAQGTETVCFLSAIASVGRRQMNILIWKLLSLDTSLVIAIGSIRWDGFFCFILHSLALSLSLSLRKLVTCSMVHFCYTHTTVFKRRLLSLEYENNSMELIGQQIGYNETVCSGNATGKLQKSFEVFLAVFFLFLVVRVLVTHMALGMV